MHSVSCFLFLVYQVFQGHKFLATNALKDDELTSRTRSCMKVRKASHIVSYSKFMLDIIYHLLSHLTIKQHFIIINIDDIFHTIK